jgi:hypothetical protein
MGKKKKECGIIKKNNMLHGNGSYTLRNIPQNSTKTKAPSRRIPTSVQRRCTIQTRKQGGRTYAKFT